LAGVRRKVADFIEEKRAAVGELEAADFLVDSAVKAPRRPKIRMRSRGDGGAI